MWLESIRDLEWRKRRFLIAVSATSLVFGLSLLLSGISASFANEVRRTVDSLNADAWLVADGMAGPFSGTATIPGELAGHAAQLPGVEDATGLLILHFTVQQSAPVDVNVIGHHSGSLAAPPLVDGRPLANPGEVVADKTLGIGLGERIALAGREFAVVGRTDGISYYAGQPTLFISLADAQQLAFAGQDRLSTVVTRGVPAAPVPGTVVFARSDVIEDLERPVAKPVETIAFVNLLLWIVAAGIIGSIVYLSALERSRDFAVFKATGASNRALLSGLALQAVVLAAASAVVAALIAVVLAPTFPMRVEIPGSAFLQLPAIAIGVGLLASLAGLRRAVAVDPAMAFGGA